MLKTRTARVKPWTLGGLTYLAIRSIVRYFVTGHPLTGTPRDNATMWHAATVDHTGRPVERLTGPIWHRIARRWAILGAPALLTALASASALTRAVTTHTPAWAALPWLDTARAWTAAAAATAAGYGAWLARRWWTARTIRREVIHPAWAATCNALSIKHHRRDANRMVHVPAGFFDATDDPEPVTITLPPGVAGDERTQTRVATQVGKTLGMPDPVTVWNLRGAAPTVQLRPRVGPPATVTFATARPHLLEGADHIDRPLIGLAAKGRAVCADYAVESPHVLVSGGSGTGKSVLFKGLLAQRIHNGAALVVMDFKMVSHRWARDLPGVVYVAEIADIHDAAVALYAELLERRKLLSAGTDTFPVLDVLVEEANALMPQLRQHWAAVRATDDPKQSPAVTALNGIVYMGRELMMHAHYAAQRASTVTFGGSGGDVRESFQTRIMARWTRQTWRMLAGGVPFVRWPGGGRGIWAVVQGDDVDIIRVPFWTDGDAREWALSGQACPDRDQLARTLSGQIPGLSGQDPDVSAAVSGQPGVLTVLPGGLSGQAPGHAGTTGRRVTLTEAVTLLPGRPISLDALRRASTRDGFPRPSGNIGPAHTYDLDDLIGWKTSRDGGSTATAPGAAGSGGVRRAGIVYAYDVTNPRTGAVVCGYVGQTRRTLAERDAEHRETQPWADLIAGAPRIVWQGAATDAELDHAEQAMITALKPLHNFDGQEGAPHATPIWRAARERAARDATS